MLRGGFLDFITRSIYFVHRCLLNIHACVTISYLLNRYQCNKIISLIERLIYNHYLYHLHSLFVNLLWDDWDDTTILLRACGHVFPLSSRRNKSLYWLQEHRPLSLLFFILDYTLLWFWWCDFFFKSPNWNTLLMFNVKNWKSSSLFDEWGERIGWSSGGKTNAIDNWSLQI
jgi:hypothetical protein